MPKIFVISGPSGVGKGTVVDGLIKKPGLNLNWVTTYTTRPPRQSHATENHYIHVNLEKFKKLESAGEIFESNLFNGNWYGSSKKLINQVLAQGKNVIVELDVNGGLAYKKVFPESTAIFITAPLEEIKKRLESRGQNTAQEIKTRFENAKQELGIAKQYDRVVENHQGNPQQAIDEVAKIIYNSLL